MKSLVADDDFIVRKIMQSILSSYGECHIAANGNEVILAFEMALEVGTPYDLICLDIMMPEVNGLETLKRIREIEKKKSISRFSDVKIIMITSKKDSNNVKGAFASGCESYLIKPVKRENLIAELEKLGLLAQVTK